MQSLDSYAGFFPLLLMTAIYFNNDKNVYRRFSSLITQKNELVDTSWQVTGEERLKKKEKLHFQQL